MNAEGEQGGMGVPGVRMDSLAEFGIPPMIAGPCSPSLEVSFSRSVLSRRCQSHSPSPLD